MSKVLTCADVFKEIRNGEFNIEVEKDLKLYGFFDRGEIKIYEDLQDAQKECGDPNVVLEVNIEDEKLKKWIAVYFLLKEQLN